MAHSLQEYVGFGPGTLTPRRLLTLLQMPVPRE